jgi:hypothetical protein
MHFPRASQGKNEYLFSASLAMRVIFVLVTASAAGIAPFAATGLSAVGSSASGGGSSFRRTNT